MAANTNDYYHETIQWIHQQMDRFEERIDKLEGQMSVATKLLEKIDSRNERLEEVHTEVQQTIIKLRADLEMNRLMFDQLKRGYETESQEHRDNKDIILQLLENDKKEKEKEVLLIEGDRGRKQERFLQIWAILGPVIASVLTSLFTKFF